MTPMEMKDSKKLRILITGITGMAGSYLAGFLLKNPHKDEIIGTYRWRSRKENIEDIADKISLIECDVRDAQSVRRVIKEVEPDLLFNMASQSSVFTSWHAPQDTITTNIIGTINIFEAVREYCPSCKILIPGSSEEYGILNYFPADENHPLQPLSPYAVSKVVQDMAGFQYQASYGLQVVRVRAFNHTGPRREPCYVESNFAMQIAQIEKGKQEPVISVGNLSSQRDYTDVRDMVRAYRLALDLCPPGSVFNICSERVVDIKFILDTLLSFSSIADRVDIRQDPSRLRPIDAPLVTGDSSPFRMITGWNPRIPLETTLKDILDYWREQMG